MIAKTAILTVQKWGNSLAVRIPAKIARNAHFQLGTPVVLLVQEGMVLVKPTGNPKLTLEDRLKLFDPEKHAGEAMKSGRIGLEKFDE